MKIPIRILLLGFVLMIICACASKENEYSKNQKIKEENEVVNAIDPEKLTLNGVKVGMGFTDLRDKISENVEVTLEEFNGKNYHFHFDDNQWTFYEDGILYFILIGKKGYGLDSLLIVGDSKELIESTLGEANFRNEGIYVYEYSDFEIQIYLEGEFIESIRMILRNSEISPSEIEQIALAEFYEGKTKTETETETVHQDDRNNDNNIQSDTNEEIDNTFQLVQLPQEEKKEDVIVKQIPPIEYLAILKKIKDDADLAFTFYLEYFSNTTDTPIAEQQAVLEERVNLYDFWNRSVALEDIEIQINEEHQLYFEYVYDYVDAIDSMLTYKLAALTSEINNPDSYAHHSFAEMAIEELENSYILKQSLFILENYEGDPLNLED